jgi:hypothetical protein
VIRRVVPLPTEEQSVAVLDDAAFILTQLDFVNVDRSTAVGCGVSSGGRWLHRLVRWFVTAIPLNRSQKLTTISNKAIGESNQYALTALSKFGKIRKANAQITHHAEETTPKAANALGIYLDFSHK